TSVARSSEEFRAEEREGRGDARRTRPLPSLATRKQGRFGSGAIEMASARRRGQGGLRAPRRGSRGARAPLADEMLLDEARVHPAARELDVPEDLGVEGNRRGDALDPELVEGSPHARDRLVAGAAVD